MITALDTNILSALWSNEATATHIAERLGEAKQNGAILISGVVYSELLAYPKATLDFVNEFCEQVGIVIDFRFPEAVWIDAGLRFAKYANRRRKAKGEGPKRLLADFLVGSHALLQADCLMTLDLERYKQDFPELRLL